MPSLMIVQGTIRDSNNFLDVKGSEKALDMSKFKASSPMRHPLYQQFFGNNNNNNNNVNDMSLERNEHQQHHHQLLQPEEQGKQ